MGDDELFIGINRFVLLLTVLVFITVAEVMHSSKRVLFDYRIRIQVYRETSFRSRKLNGLFH